MGIKDACAGQNAQTGQAASPSLNGGSGLGMESASFSACWGDGKPIDPRCYAPPEHLQGSNYANAKPVNNSSQTPSVAGSVAERIRGEVDFLVRMHNGQVANIGKMQKESDALRETITMLRRDAMKYDSTKEQAEAWEAVWSQLRSNNGYRTDLVRHCGTNDAVTQIAELQRKARAFDMMVMVGTAK